MGNGRSAEDRQPATGNRQPDVGYDVAAEAAASGFEENGPVTDYTDLEVWQVAMSLTTECYRTTRTFPADERFGLISQIRRAAVSIPANIAEGYGRQSSGSYAQFLKISQGSVKELPARSFAPIGFPQVGRKKLSQRRREARRHDAQ